MSYCTKDFDQAPAIPKNRLERIRVFKHNYLGTDLVSVRLFSPRGVPSHKGITLRPECWREVLPHIEKLLIDDEEGGDIT